MNTIKIMALVPSFGVISKFKVKTGKLQLLKVFSQMPPYYVGDLLDVMVNDESFEVYIKNLSLKVVKVDNEILRVDNNFYESTDYFNPSLVAAK